MQTKWELFLCGFLDIIIGIRGNEAADRAAKEALNIEPTAGLVPFSSLKPSSLNMSVRFGRGSAMKLV